MEVSDAYQYPLRAMVRFALEDLTAGAAEALHQIPPGATVTGGSLVVETAADSGTTATLNVGDSDSATRYLSGTDLKTTGRTAFTLDGYKYAAPDDLLATFNQTGADATEVEGYIEFEIIIENRANEAVS